MTILMGCTSVYQDALNSLASFTFCPYLVLFGKTSAFNMANLKHYTSVVNEECEPTPLGSPNEAGETNKPFGTFNPNSNQKRLSDIHWVSPTKMVSFLLFGILMSLSHHLYYQSRTGEMVGDENEQQNEHRLVFKPN